MKNSFFLLSLLMIVFQSNVFAQISNGVVAHYPFDGDANDAIGTIDGNVVDASLTTDRFGNDSSAYAFTTTGNRSFIDLGDNFNTVTSGTSSQFSISIWFKRSDLTEAMQLFSKFGSNWCGEINHQYTLSIEAGGTIFFNYYDASAGTANGIIANYQRSSYRVTNTEWHHLVMTYDATVVAGQQRAVFYLDNVLLPSILTNNGSNVGTIATRTAHIGIGHSLSSTGALCGGSTGYGSVGSIDDVRLYSRLLPNCDIRDLYTEGDNTASLVAYYPFDGNADDAIGNRNGVVDSAVLTMDRFGNPNKAYKFERGNRYGYIGLGDNFNDITAGTEGSFGISLWFKRADMNNAMQLFSKFGNTWCNEVKNQYALGVKGDGTVYFNYYQTGGSVRANYENSVSKVNDTAWHHVVVAYNGAISTGNRRVTMYLDGNPLATVLTNNGTHVSSMVASNAHVGIGHSLNSSGARCGNTGYGSDGSIDDVYVYGRLLGQCDVTDLYNKSNPVITTVSSLMSSTIEMKLYPNPATSVLNVEVELDGVNTPSFLEVITMTGQILVVQSLEQSMTSIDVSNLATGVYFVRVSKDSGQMNIQKFIKE